MMNQSKLTKKQKYILVNLGIVISAILVLLGIIFSLISVFYNWGSALFVTWIMVELLALLIFIWLIISVTNSKKYASNKDTSDDWLEEAKKGTE